MRKRLFSILLALCMVLCLVPTTAFAESETEETPVCTCETACTAEAMNTECPVCGAVGALPESCAKCSGPVEDAAAEPEVEDNEAQPEASPVVLSGKREIKSEAELNVALGDKSCTEITLGENIELSGGYIISHTVTLDLNGYTLTVNGNEWDIFSVYESGNLTVKDSGTGGKIDGQNKNCGFCIYGGVLTLESGTIINCMTDGDGSAVDISSGDSEGVYGKFVMNGGAITNCKATDDGGAVDIGKGCTFIMNSGTISGCRADDDAGAIFIKGNASFVMNGGTIENCSAGFCGGAVKIRNTSSFTMTGGTISNCTAQQGGGVYMNGGKFEMNSGAIIGCTANNNGGGVSVRNGIFTMTNGSISDCTAVNGDAICLRGGTMNANGGTVDGGITMPYTVGNNTVYMDGLGTAAYPYQISTADQLKLFRDIVNGAGGQTQNRGACAVLTAVIDLNNEPWTPIGNYTEENKIYYEGTFDGGGHTISGLNVTGDFRCASLFGAVKGGTIKNLTVAGNVSHNYNSTGLDCHVGGIVGGALDAATIENCSNNCSVTGGSGDFIGGIAGSNIDNARIIDCYNVGTITGTISGTGGVTGLNMGTISNCYNVGTIKTLYNSDAVGEIVGNNSGTVENCYYLAGTNLNAVGRNESNGNITKTESKTAANFANDTVLALLKADRDNSPWDSCQYVAAAKITLPVFKGQGDAHEHNGNWTSNGDGTHSRHCTCNAVETVNCSGGKATCTAKAVCEVCKAEYGEKLPHDFTAETVNAKYLKSAATCTEKAVYYKSCAVCGLSSKGTADEATFFSGNALGHDWGDWTPSSNKTHTRTCKTDSTHTETKNCADDNKDHVCDTCGATLTQHSGGTASCAAPATCGYCGKPYGEKNPANHSDLKHVPAKAATTQAEGNSEYWLCSGCGKCYKDAAAATEIALSDTVIAKRTPRRYSGPTITVMGAAYYDGGNVGLTFVSSADFDTFTGVQVDGKTLAAKNYIAERGSIEVYLKAVYLRTLKNGSHTVTIQSTAGDVSAVFTVENSKTSPGTSDPGVAVYALSSMLSLTGLAALRRRKED